MCNISVITMIHIFDGIIGHNIGHNRSKTVAMPNGIFRRKIGIIRWCLVPTLATAPLATIPCQAPELGPSPLVGGASSGQRNGPAGLHQRTGMCCGESRVFEGFWRLR